MLDAQTLPALPCPDCGTEVAPHFLICPGCHRLVHAEELKKFAAEAAAAEASSDWTAALVAWRSALELLPTTSRQHQVISGKITEIGWRIDAGPARAPETTPASGGWAGGAAGLGTLGLMLWKFKFLAGMILLKGKFLLLGLTKLSTLLSMFVTLGAYWSLWGWPFALGLVLTTYVHEMGHVMAFRRYGLKADAPMFIPGFGAFIRGRQAITDARQEAQIGLGGPLWGAGAVAICLGLSLATGQLIFAGIARFAAVINLFNLIPIWQLDGAHAFKVLSRSQRWLATAAASTLWALTDQSNQIGYTVLLFVTICSAYQAAFVTPPAKSDRLSAVEYIGLMVLLTLATWFPIPLP